MGWGGPTQAPVRLRRITLVYPEGIRFSCTRCGRCCRERTALLLPLDVDRISSAYGLRPDQFAEPVENLSPYTHRVKKQSGACIFYREGGCSIYPNRPLSCAFYPFALIPMGREYMFILADECPGVGRGPVLGREFFERLLLLYLKASLCSSRRTRRAGSMRRAAAP